MQTHECDTCKYAQVVSGTLHLSGAVCNPCLPGCLFSPGSLSTELLFWVAVYSICLRVDIIIPTAFTPMYAHVHLCILMYTVKTRVLQWRQIWLSKFCVNMTPPNGVMATATLKMVSLLHPTWCHYNTLNFLGTYFTNFLWTLPIMKSECRNSAM